MNTDREIWSSWVIWSMTGPHPAAATKLPGRLWERCEAIALGGNLCTPRRFLRVDEDRAAA